MNHAIVTSLLQHYTYRALCDTFFSEQEWYYYAISTPEPTTSPKNSCPCIVKRNDKNAQCKHHILSGSAFCRTHTQQLNFVRQQKELNTTKMMNSELDPQARLQAAVEVLHYRKIAMSIFADGDKGHMKAIVWTEQEIADLQQLIREERNKAKDASKNALKKKNKRIQNNAVQTQVESSNQARSNLQTPRQIQLILTASKLGLKVEEEDMTETNLLESLIEDIKNKKEEMEQMINDTEKENVKQIEEAISSIYQLTEHICIFTSPFPNNGTIVYMMIYKNITTLWANSIFNYDFKNQRACKLLTTASAIVPVGENLPFSIDLTGIMYSDQYASFVYSKTDLSKLIEYFKKANVELIAIRRLKHCARATNNDLKEYLLFNANKGHSYKVDFDDKNIFDHPKQPFYFPYDIYTNFLSLNEGGAAEKSALDFCLDPSGTIQPFKDCIEIVSNKKIWQQAFQREMLFNISTASESLINWLTEERSRQIKEKSSEIRKNLLKKLKQSSAVTQLQELNIS